METITGIIEGMPASYDVSYIIKTDKKCGVCKQKITAEEINAKQIVYADRIEFCHKKCLEGVGIIYEHLKENDLNSPIRLLKKGTKEKVKITPNTTIKKQKQPQEETLPFKIEKNKIKKSFGKKYYQYFFKENQLIALVYENKKNEPIKFDLKLFKASRTKSKKRKNKIFSKSYTIKKEEINQKNKVETIYVLLKNFMVNYFNS